MLGNGWVMAGWRLSAAGVDSFVAPAAERRTAAAAAAAAGAAAPDSGPEHTGLICTSLMCRGHVLLLLNFRPGWLFCFGNFCPGGPRWLRADEAAAAPAAAAAATAFEPAGREQPAELRSAGGQESA